MDEGSVGELSCGEIGGAEAEVSRRERTSDLVALELWRRDCRAGDVRRGEGSMVVGAVVEEVEVRTIVL